MSAAHKLCRTKLNSNKMPSQIYIILIGLSSVILYNLYLHCIEVPLNPVSLMTTTNFKEHAIAMSNYSGTLT